MEKILVIEDNKDYQFLIQSALTNEFKISAADSGKQGVELAREFKPDLILLDISLGDMDGFEVCKEIKKDDFIDLALNDYRELAIDEPNKPRFLDIAGKALGYVGSNSEVSQITNNIQVNITGSESQSELWEMTRKILG